MSGVPTYPGVYIREESSGVRTITGVSSSVTAFLGRTARGAVDRPVTVNNFGEYERAFGGLSAGDPLGYAVRAFFQNGGGQAIVVRAYKPPTATKDGVATLALGGLKLTAVNPGSWGNALTAAADRDGITADVAARFGVPADTLFNLVVTDPGQGATERFANVTVTDGPRRVDRVLKQQSRLVRVTGDLPTGNPAMPAPAPKSAAKDAADVTVVPVVSDAATGGDDGKALAAADFVGSQDAKTGLYALDRTDLFNLLCIPPDTPGGDVPSSVYQEAMTYCAARRAILLVDPPADWDPLGDDPAAFLGDFAGPDARNAAIYFPRLVQPDPLQDGADAMFVSSGAVAGVIARTDTQRGIWKAPAGIDAAVTGVNGLTTNLTDAENGRLNPLGVNCLRSFPAAGVVVWGARTLRGSDQLADDYKYLPVRRLALYLEESLYRGCQWAVFEPNDEPLWSQLRLNVGVFLQDLFRQGAFAGRSPREAYSVKCDHETTTASDVNNGVVNVVVGFAPLRPAEFVVITIQQSAGQP
jgi:phage tail sheath protein FI